MHIYGVKVSVNPWNHG